MALYNVTYYTASLSGTGAAADALTIMTDKLGTITNSKVVRLAKIIKTPDNKHAVVMIYDA